MGALALSGTVLTWISGSAIAEQDALVVDPIGGSICDQDGKGLHVSVPVRMANGDDKPEGQAKESLLQTINDAMKRSLEASRVDRGHFDSKCLRNSLKENFDHVAAAEKEHGLHLTATVEITDDPDSLCTKAGSMHMHHHMSPLTLQKFPANNSFRPNFWWLLRDLNPQPYTGGEF